MRSIMAIAAVLALLLTFSTTAGVQAHAAFITSNPEPDSTISAPVDEIRIIFSETIMRASTIQVTAPDGTVVSGDTNVNDNIATVTVQWSGPGVYQVAWRNVSADDGHESSGTFQFTLGG